MKRKLPLLSGLAILGVVLHHASNWGFIAMFWWPHMYRPVESPNYEQIGSFSYFSLVTINQLALFSVPAFLFIAGVFISYASSGSQTDVSWKVIYNRLKWLLIPYLIWSMLHFIFDGLQGQIFTPLEYLLKIITGKAVGAYFFIPLLAQFYILSPWIAKWAKKRPSAILIGSFVITFTLICMPYLALNSGNSEAVYNKVQAFNWLFVRWLFFFVFGLTLGNKWVEVSIWINRRRRILLCCTLLFGFLSITESQWIYQKTSIWDWSQTPLKFSSLAYSPFFIVTFLSYNVVPRVCTALVSMIGSMSYGIYLIHPKTVEVVSRVIYHLAPWVLGKQLIMQPVLIVVALLLPIALMRVVTHSRLKPAYRFLFG